MRILLEKYANRIYCTDTDTIYTGFSCNRPVKRNQQGKFIVKVNGVHTEVPEHYLTMKISASKVNPRSDAKMKTIREITRDKVKGFLLEPNPLRNAEISRKCGVTQTSVSNIKKRMIYLGELQQ